jgi:3'-5' exoribonuclease
VQRRHKRDGSSFLRLTLADRAGGLPGIPWDADASGADALEVGRAVHVFGRVGEHPRYGRQITVDDMHDVDPEQGAWDELLSGPARPAHALEADVGALIASVSDRHLRALLETLLGRDTLSGRRYRQIPAAKYHHHHAYPHGLLDHSLAVATMVAAAAAAHPQIDRDLAVTGALLHDIGKLEAYAVTGGCADLTDAGKLEGEIPLGYYRVRQASEAIPGFPPHRAQALLHILLSHHGRLEFGSPVTPCTREAALVHAMDNPSRRGPPEPGLTRASRSRVTPTASTGASGCSGPRTKDSGRPWVPIMGWRGERAS